MTRVTRNLLLFYLLAAAGCDSAVPEGRIAFRNDSQDSSYNVVAVSGGGLTKSLKPGDEVLLPRGTTQISLSRRYKDHTRAYEVECPGRIGKGIRMKLIDVHLNRMPGGCKTIRGGKE